MNCQYRCDIETDELADGSNATFLFLTLTSDSPACSHMPATACVYLDGAVLDVMRRNLGCQGTPKVPNISLGNLPSIGTLEEVMRRVEPLHDGVEILSGILHELARRTGSTRRLLLTLKARSVPETAPLYTAEPPPDFTAGRPPPDWTESIDASDAGDGHAHCGNRDEHGGTDSNRGGGGPQGTEGTEGTESTRRRIRALWDEIIRGRAGR